jgi:hypothetical protein
VSKRSTQHHSFTIERIVLTYDMHLDNAASREHGTKDLLNNLGVYLEK